MKVASIAKNTSYFTFALILQKIISFSYFTLLARYLVPEDLGSYYLAISFTTIFAIVIDLGLANVLTREIARDDNRSGQEKREKDQRLFRTVVLIKLPLAIFAVLMVLILSLFLGYSDLVRSLIYISMISMVLDSFAICFWSYIRGYHVLKYESVGVVLFQVFVFGVGLSFINAGYGLIPLMWVMAIASIAVFIFSASIVIFKFKTSIFPVFDKALISYIVRLSIPFALFAVLQRLYMYLDSVLLSVLAGNTYVGLYQIAFKIIFALQFLPMAFIASLYPAFALYYKSNKDQLSISFERAINYLLIIALPISFGAVALADKIILIFKPEYMAAVWPLRIVMLSLIFIFLNFPIGALLNACDRQKINTRNMAFTLLASIVLNLLLIPRFQAIGASITVLVSNFFMFVLGVYSIGSIGKYRIAKMLKVFIKSFVSAILMSLIVYYFREDVYIFINVLIGALIYTVGILLSGAFRLSDLESIINSFKK